MEPLNTYDVGQEITLQALFLTGATVGTMSKGQTTVYVRDLTGLDLTVGAAIVIEGAGYVGGDLRTTVVSHDTVGAIVVADAARAEASRCEVGTPTDPATVTCKVAKPDGTEDTVTASSTLSGLWVATFTPAIDGEFYYRFAGTGQAAGDGWRKFLVRPERVA